MKALIDSIKFSQENLFIAVGLGVTKSSVIDPVESLGLICRDLNINLFDYNAADFKSTSIALKEAYDDIQNLVISSKKDYIMLYVSIEEEMEIKKA